MTRSEWQAFYADQAERARGRGEERSAAILERFARDTERGGTPRQAGELVPGKTYTEGERVEAELKARSAMIADFKRDEAERQTRDKLDAHRAAERRSGQVYRGLLAEHFGHELRAWDRDNADVQAAEDLIERMDDARHDAELDELRDAWIDRRGIDPFKPTRTEA
jgi:hypothetical protein